MPSRVYGRPRMQETPGGDEEAGEGREEEARRRRRRRRRRSKARDSQREAAGRADGGRPITKRRSSYGRRSHGRCSKDGKVEEHPLEPVRPLGARSLARAPGEAKQASLRDARPRGARVRRVFVLRTARNTPRSGGEVDERRVQRGNMPVILYKSLRKDIQCLIIDVKRYFACCI